MVVLCRIKIDDAVYSGQMKNGLRDGQGCCVYEDGSKYEGEWQRGNWHGEGRYTDSRGSMKEGRFEDNRQMQGNQETVEQAAAAGNQSLSGINQQQVFNSSLPIHGDAEFHYADGGVFSGSWQAGKPVDGRGTRMRLPGCKTVYSGEIRDSLYHGQGKAVYQNGDQYTGDWIQGSRHGGGEIVRAVGGTFRGQWEADVPWEGTMNEFVNANGDCYSGELRAGKYEGSGVLQYKYGSVFRGEFQQGRAAAGRLERAD